MQQISANLFNGQAPQTEGAMLPFTFGMPTEQANLFGDMLQQTVSNLQSGELDNAEFAQQLEAIRQNIPDELIADFEGDFSKEELDSEEIAEEISTTALAVLNIIDNIVDNLPEIETKDQLESSLAESGLSNENISAIFDILDLPEQPTEFKNADIVAEQTNILAKSTESAPLQAQNTQNIAKFKNNQLSASQLFSEKVISGENIAELTNSTDKIIEKATPAEEIPLVEASQTQTQKTTENTTEPEKTPKKGLADILNLFKKSKTETAVENMTIEKKVVEKSTSIEQNTTELKTTNKQTSELTASQMQATAKPEIQKTNGELNKSEFKELASKFVASLSDDVTTEAEFSPELAKTETVAPTVATQMNKAFTTKVEGKILFDNFEIADVENTQQNSDTAEVQEAKPLASNLNMQLYKTAQQANIQNQIGLAIKNFKNGSQQIKVKLHPEELGSVTIDLDMVDNMARGVITVEKPEVAQHLAQNLNKMFEGFKQSGVNVDTKDIVVQLDDHKQNKQQFAQNKDEPEQTIELNLSEDELDIVL